MSIFKGSIWQGSPFLGSIWRSGQGYGKYAAYFDFERYGLIDKVSRKSLTCTIPGTRYDYDDNGNVITATANLPMIVPGRGLRGVGSDENLIPYSSDLSEWVVQTANGVSIDDLGNGEWRINFGDSGKGVYIITSNGNGSIGDKYISQIEMKSESLSGDVSLYDPSGRLSNDYEVTVTITPIWAKYYSGVGTLEIDNNIGIYIRKSSTGLSSLLVRNIQLVKSAYPLPYIPTNGATDTSVSEAGAADYGVWADGLQENFPAWFDALDGVADGDELDQDPYFNDPTKHNTSGVIENNSASLLYDKYVFDLISFQTGKNYEIFLNGTGNAKVKYGHSGTASIYEFVSLPYFKRKIADSDFNRTQIVSNDDLVVVTQMSVKEISPAKGTLTLTWQPGYNASEAPGEHTLLSFDGTTANLRYDATNNQLEITDGTNIAVVSCTSVAGTEYAIKATWEDDEMQITVDSTDGTVADFVGTFNPGTDLNFLMNDELNYIKDLAILKEPDWS